ncbi:uncharacterized protein LOC132404384 isoform X1 [Hypanus sabinus]|uniref:uncharacterized protein LOC132404384 isoform X1 n=1 Tax=Hypanus sabinus TaxID=79690 RepID=UPI0028C40786|nr:uncharacterized protein LOC132404384 isoform X1 [Hypanus sabinus]
MADTLEAALHNADAVQPRDTPPVPWTHQTPLPPVPMSEFANAAASRNSTNSPNPTTAAASHKPAQCYFCGPEKHPQKRCPAREATCSSCGKKGHFAKVCKSKPLAGSGSTACETWGPPSCMPGCGRPSLSASTCPAPDPPVLTRHQDGGSTLATVTLDQSARHQLARSMMDILVEGHRTSCLFGTCSTESFIDRDTVQCCGLVTRPVSQRVTLASGSYSTDIRVGCVATLVVQGTEYRDFALLVMPQLCAPVLLGLDFQSHLESVTMAYDGPLPPLTVRNP